MRLDQAESASLGRKLGRKFVSEQTTYGAPRPMKAITSVEPRGYHPSSHSVTEAILPASFATRLSRVEIRIPTQRTLAASPHVQKTCGLGRVRCSLRFSSSG
jgi:hypothetical protein